MNFDSHFEQLTGHAPLPWQHRLFERMSQGLDQIPKRCVLPTGLGKTSVMAVWLLAMAEQAVQGSRILTLPRRLVYVVNRRTVVDQATTEAEKLRENLLKKSELKSVRESLALLCSQEKSREEPLAISTLRGQFADNGQWLADPSRPAIIVGTVDMIGSRLLFSGYRVGFKHRPLHAAYLGKDVLLVHDEAHLEQPFQKLIEAIAKEQDREADRSGEAKQAKPFRIMALSATPRGEGGENDFGLDVQDFKNKIVKKRLTASKQLFLQECDEKDSELAKQIAQLATSQVFQNQAILIYVRRVETVLKLQEELRKAKVNEDQLAVLTGTIRGKERDDLARHNPVFQRYLKEPLAPVKTGAVFLLSTSAGEVGVNITADHLICDLTTFENMAQRFGRVNRFGDKDALIHVLHPSSFGVESKTFGEFEQRRELTLSLLRSLPRDDDNVYSASLESLATLNLKRRLDAFSPTPQIRETTDILLDAWSLTTITGLLPGRPPIENWLHGITEWEPPQTQFLWRSEIELPRSILDMKYEPKELIDAYPFHHDELLTESRDRAFKFLQQAAKVHPDAPVWLVNNQRVVFWHHDDGRRWTLADIVEDKEMLNDVTVVLSPLVGGRNLSGMLDSTAIAPRVYIQETLSEYRNELARLKLALATDSLDISSEVGKSEVDGRKTLLRQRLFGNSLKGDEFKLKLSIDFGEFITEAPEEFSEEEELPDDIQRDRYLWNWYVRVEDDPEAFGEKEQELSEHLGLAVQAAASLVDAIGLTGQERDAVIIAAKYHDLGKYRQLWQRAVGNTAFRDHATNKKVLAKSGKKQMLRLTTAYRHEFGSLHDIRAQEDFQALDEDSKELVLHLIAAHHGRARPHFPVDVKKDRDEAYDPLYTSAENAELASQVPSRFARLQRRYGRWGLAYLESLVRSADILASQASLKNSLQGVQITQPRPTTVPKPKKPEANIRIDVDVTNPGQFFACCGLLELADRRWPGAEGWFEEGEFCVACGGTLKTLIEALTASSFRGIDSGNATSSPIQIEAPFDLLLNWWHDQLSGGREMKVWAGTMEGLRIARAMQSTMAQSMFHNSGLLNVGTIAYDAENPVKKVEPFYFDARRGPNAHNRDVGFSANTLSLTSTAHPAVELLCLIGLQRVTPARGEATRLYRYATWSAPIAAMLATSATSDLLRIPVERSYQFENWYRTGQKKHKAFLPSIPLASRGAT